MEIPGITVPNIWAVLYVQNRLLAYKHNIRTGQRIRELLAETESEVSP